jgi:lipopolysaccharide/colanic/teichoic acid biosynthesis glycosyltransferase
MELFRRLSFENFGNSLLAGIFLILLSPVLLALALTVLIFDGRPVLFTQRRLGFQGKIFRLHKFRTMKHKGDSNLDGEEKEVTALGKYLRILSLDELPQLWNVMSGDMHFVGPRPLPEDYRPLFSAEQFRRHEVRPGITGLAQISGRNSLTWEEKFELDVEYVDTKSALGDLVIVMRTVPAVFFARNIGSGRTTLGEPFRGQSHQ